MTIFIRTIFQSVRDTESLPIYILATTAAIIISVCLVLAVVFAFTTYLQIMRTAFNPPH